MRALISAKLLENGVLLEIGLSNSQEQFRLIVTTKREEPPAWLADKLEVIKVSVPSNFAEKAAESGTAGVWVDGEAPVEERSKEQKKLDKEFLDCCFEGETEEVEKLLGQGADSNAVDGRGYTALSEASCAGSAAFLDLDL